MMSLLRAALVLALLLFAAVPALADSRVALVIGNASYDAVGALANPVRDAALIADALKADGFAVTFVRDASRTALIEAMNRFNDQADQADWALVYYAGHGIEVGGVNYLLPTDARLRVDRDAPDEAVALTRVLDTVANARKLRLVILDACRSNPFAAAMRRTVATRAVGRGLARVEPQAGILVVYAAAAGEVAEDDADGHSPFTTALAARLRQPGLEVRRLFDAVTADVLRATAQRQRPYQYGSNPSEEAFYFTPPAPVPSIAAAPPGADMQQTAYLAAMQAGTADAFAGYLARYPTGPFATLVKLELARLQRSTATAAPAPPQAEAPDGQASHSEQPAPPDGDRPTPGAPSLAPAQPASAAHLDAPGPVHPHPDQVANLPGAATTTAEVQAAKSRSVAAFQSATRVFTDQDHALAVEANGNATVYDIASGSVVSHLSLQPKETWQLLSHDGHRAISYKYDNKWFEIIDTKSGKVVAKCSGHSNWINQFIFSPDESYVLTASADWTLRLWDLKTGRAVKVFAGHQHQVRTAVFSSNGRFIFSNGDDDTARVWDVVTGRAVRTFKSDPTGGIAISPDGDRVAFVNDASQSGLWSVASGELLLSVPGQFDASEDNDGMQVSHLAFAPDGSKLMYIFSPSENSDDRVAVFDIAKKQQIASLAISADSKIISIRSSLNGERALAVTKKGIIDWSLR